MFSCGVRTSPPWVSSVPPSKGLSMLTTRKKKKPQLAETHPFEQLNHHGTVDVYDARVDRARRNHNRRRKTLEGENCGLKVNFLSTLLRQSQATEPTRAHRGGGVFFNGGGREGGCFAVGRYLIRLSVCVVYSMYIQ